MSLRLKGRKVYRESEDDFGFKWITYGRITDDPIIVRVQTEQGDVIAVKEKDPHFDLKKRGKGK